jgi:hypothetical protein
MTKNEAETSETRPKRGINLCLRSTEIFPVWGFGSKRPVRHPDVQTHGDSSSFFLDPTGDRIDVNDPFS